MSRRKQQEDKERISSLVDSMYESSSRFDRLHDRFNKTNSPEDANEILEDLMFMVQVFDWPTTGRRSRRRPRLPSTGPAFSIAFGGLPSLN